MIDKNLLKSCKQIKKSLTNTSLDNLLLNAANQSSFNGSGINYSIDGSDNDSNMPLTPFHSYKSIEELAEIDKQREKDGFPKKIKIRRVVWKASDGKKKVAFLPSVTEDQFVHDNEIRFPDEGSPTSGSGKGDVGDVIAEAPAEPESEEGDGRGGDGEREGEYEIDNRSYELGKFLAERLKLPNLKEKSKKTVFKQYTYDLTDKQIGHGQLLDKKATLKKIIETNLALGNIPDKSNIDPTKFIITPKDKAYRLLSREKEYESQALVFLVRDCSGSMNGKPADVIIMQHFLLHSILDFQYEKKVDLRFIVHDTSAKEITNFNDYYNIITAGGTNIYTGFAKVNEIVRAGNLNKDYNIYVFYGGDGEDYDDTGKKTIEELEKILQYASRVGVTTVNRHSKETLLDSYLRGSGLLEKHQDLIRLDSAGIDEWDEDRILKGIQNLMAE